MSTALILTLIAAVLVWTAAALAAGIVLGRAVDRRDRLTLAAEAWDNGFCHGIDTAHTTVASYRKPWITCSEELGWDLARTTLTAALDALRRTPDGDTGPDPAPRTEAAA